MLNLILKLFYPTFLSAQAVITSTIQHSQLSNKGSSLVLIVAVGVLIETFRNKQVFPVISFFQQQSNILEIFEVKRLFLINHVCLCVLNYDTIVPDLYECEN